MIKKIVLMLFVTALISAISVTVISILIYGNSVLSDDYRSSFYLVLAYGGSTYTVILFVLTEVCTRYERLMHYVKSISKPGILASVSIFLALGIFFTQRTSYQLLSIYLIFLLVAYFSFVATYRISTLVYK